VTPEENQRNLPRLSIDGHGYAASLLYHKTYIVGLSLVSAFALQNAFLLEINNARTQILLTHLPLFFLAASSGGNSSPSTGGFPFPTRFRMRAILSGSARRARAAKYSSVRKAEIFS
jgi:predicted outer membrane lipoprotein